MESRRVDWYLWIPIAATVFLVLVAGARMMAARKMNSALKDVQTSGQNLYVMVKEKAAAGDAESQFVLANFYEIGLGAGTIVAKDQQQALFWYRKAAQQGHPWAQRTLNAYEKTGVLAAVLPPEEKPPQTNARR
jgi:TPR repeat protein